MRVGLPLNNLLPSSAHRPLLCIGVGAAGRHAVTCSGVVLSNWWPYGEETRLDWTRLESGATPPQPRANYSARGSIAAWLSRRACYGIHVSYNTDRATVAKVLDV